MIPESIFLHGPALYNTFNAGTPIVQVDIPGRPEGRRPLCTLANAKRYHLHILLRVR